MSQPQDPQTASPSGPTCYRHADRETWIKCQRCERPICPDCMNDASVGFQCPDCVRAGHKSTRQPTLVSGGRPSANPALTSMVLIGINVTIWLAVMVSGRSSSRLLDFFMLSPQGHCASLADPSKYYPNATTSEACQHIALLGDGQWANGFADGWWWQALTSAFTHSALTHVAFNMLALWFLGPALESVIGRARFLAVYLLAALAGSVAVLWLGEASASTLGASGAIWGLLAAHIVGARRFKGDTRSLMTWLALNVAFTVVIPGISWQAHLGGFAGGALAAAIIFYAPRERRTQIQVLGLGALTLVIVVLMALRAAALS